MILRESVHVHTRVMYDNMCITLIGVSVPRSMNKPEMVKETFPLFIEDRMTFCFSMKTGNSWQSITRFCPQVLSRRTWRCATKMVPILSVRVKTIRVRQYSTGARTYTKFFMSFIIVLT